MYKHENIKRGGEWNVSAVLYFSNLSSHKTGPSIQLFTNLKLHHSILFTIAGLATV